MLDRIHDLREMEAVETLVRVVRGAKHLLEPVSLSHLLSHSSVSELLDSKLNTIDCSISIQDICGDVLFGALPEANMVRHAVKSEGRVLGWVQGRGQDDYVAVMLAHLLSAEAKRAADDGEQHRLLRIFADASVESMHILDRELKILFINRVALEALQLAFPEVRNEDVVGQDLRHIYPFLVEQGVDIKLSDVIETGVPLHEEITVLHPVSGVRHLDVRAFKVGEGLGIVVTDISRRKQAEEKQRVSEEKLRSTLASLDDLVFSLNRSGVFTDYFQPPSSNLLVPPEEFIGKSLREVLPPHVASTAQEAIELAIETDTVQRFEYSLFLGDNEQWFDAKISNQKDASGEIFGTTTVVRNVTEHKQAEKQRLQLALEQERTKLIADFVRQVSHEFRTPLAVITMNAYLLTGVASPDERQQYRDSIDEQVRNIVRLVDNMLLLSKLDSGQVIETSRIDLNQVLRAIHESNQPAFHNKGLDCRCILSEPALFAQGNAKYFELAIEQLLNNAIRHNLAGGSIIIRSELAAQKAIVEIVDTGSGISHEDLLHIFERFYRADRAGTTSGFGLGLPIVQAVIERLGGLVEVESVEGKGSTFRIVLPGA